MSVTSEHNAYPTLLINCLEMFKGRRPYNPQLSPGRHFTALTGPIGHVRLTHTITYSLQQ